MKRNLNTLYRKRPLQPVQPAACRQNPLYPDHDLERTCWEDDRGYQALLVRILPVIEQSSRPTPLYFPGEIYPQRYRPRLGFRSSIVHLLPILLPVPIKKGVRARFNPFVRQKGTYDAWSLRRSWPQFTVDVERQWEVQRHGTSDGLFSDEWRTRLRQEVAVFNALYREQDDQTATGLLRQYESARRAERCQSYLYHIHSKLVDLYRTRLHRQTVWKKYDSEHGLYYYSWTPSSCWAYFSRVFNNLATLTLYLLPLVLWLLGCLVKSSISQIDTVLFFFRERSPPNIPLVIWRC